MQQWNYSPITQNLLSSYTQEQGTKLLGRHPAQTVQICSSPPELSASYAFTALAPHSSHCFEHFP